MTAFPAAPAIRPQFGSLPWAAAFTRLLDTTARATARASASSCAPRTEVVMRIVAPSPSAACCRARSRATASSARRGPQPRGLPAAIGAAADAPDASTNTVSLVLVSPSTDSWSHVRAAAGRSRLQSTSGGAAASVRTIDSIVAMFGWIIPTPLAMPVTVTVTGSPSPAGQDERRRRDLGHRVRRAQRLRGRSECRVVLGELRRERLDTVPRPCRAAAASR